MPSQPVNKQTPIWRNILIRNVTSVEGDTAGRIVGLAEMPVTGIEFENVKLSATRPMQIVWANGIRFFNSRIIVGGSLAITASHSQILGIDVNSGD
jgi:hypothetical protein